MPSTMPEDWTIRHFSQAIPVGEDRSDVAALLRRVADTLDDYDETPEVQDLVLHTDVEDGGLAHSLTVYFSLPGDDDAAADAD
jgi:hypothetical protein